MNGYQHLQLFTPDSLSSYAPRAWNTKTPDHRQLRPILFEWVIDLDDNMMRRLYSHLHDNIIRISISFLTCSQPHSAYSYLQPLSCSAILLIHKTVLLLYFACREKHHKSCIHVPWTRMWQKWDLKKIRGSQNTPVSQKKATTADQRIVIV